MLELSVIALVLLLMLAGAIWVVWDMHMLNRKKSSPIDRQALQKGFAPKGVTLWQAHLCGFLLSAMKALSEWQSPRNPPFTGKSAWVHQQVYDLAGPDALWMLSLVAAVAFLMGAILSFRRTGHS